MCELIYIYYIYSNRQNIHINMSYVHICNINHACHSFNFGLNCFVFGYLTDYGKKMPIHG